MVTLAIKKQKSTGTHSKGQGKQMESTELVVTLSKDSDQVRRMP